METLENVEQNFDGGTESPPSPPPQTKAAKKTSKKNEGKKAYSEAVKTGTEDEDDSEQDEDEVEIAEQDDEKEEIGALVPPENNDTTIWDSVLHGDVDDWMQQLVCTLRAMPGAMFVPGDKGIREFTVQLLLYQSLRDSMCNSEKNAFQFSEQTLQLVVEGWLMRRSTEENAAFPWRFGYVDLWAADHGSKRAVLVEIKYERMAYLNYANKQSVVNTTMRLPDGAVKRDEDGNVERVKPDTYRYRTAHGMAAITMNKSSLEQVNVKEMQRFDPVKRARESLHTIIERLRTQVDDVYLEGLAHEHEWPEQKLPPMVKKTFSEAKKVHLDDSYTLFVVCVIVYGNRVYYETDRYKTKRDVSKGHLKYRKIGSTQCVHVE